jgi:uncharacterized protein YrrD
MQKGKSVIGKDVLSHASGARIHSVKDILIGETNDRIVALLVDEGGLLGTSTIVPFEAIGSFGRDAVVIESEASVLPASNDPDVKAILNRSDHLRGKTVFTEDGRRMGSIADIYFEDATGRILGFEVSSGTLGDLAAGPSYLALDEVRVAGRDVVLIDPRAADSLESQKGGLQGALADAGDKLGEAATGARDQLESGVTTVREQGGEETPEMRLVGKRSGADVTDEHGSIVVASGQRITLEQVQLAKETGNLEPLYIAAEAGEARERDERASEIAQQVGDTASDLWDRFTTRLRDMTDAQGQRVDEQQTRTTLAQINDAIGRPVTKVILDRNDDVILDLGDIITHQAVQRAYEAGKLDTLLASSYRGEVTFAREEMRARVEATSTVDKAAGGAQVVDELAGKLESAERERQAAEEAKRSETEASRQQKQRERDERARAREEAAREREDAARQQREAVAISVEDPVSAG